MTTIIPLKNSIQEYAWGSTRAIPDLLGYQNSENRPQAELWMGAHPKAPSLAFLNNQWVSLQKVIEQDPEIVLGQKIAKKFNNRLPFLFKVLAAAKPLSIQAHPDRDQAEKGFQRENAQKIPLDAAHRNYRDDNHKPECLCALTRFWALSRFRKIKEILSYFEQLKLKQLNSLIRGLSKKPTADGLQQFYTTLMHLKQDQKNAIVDEALNKARRIASDHVAFEWMMKLSEHYPNDIGVLSPIFLNLVCLEPGQAIYLNAGELHAYLEGLGIELMANSDNVLRGGLTPKHVDVPELLKVLNFEAHDITLLKPGPSAPCEQIYSCPAAEFVLSVISLKNDLVYESPGQRSVEIIICTRGNMTIADSEYHNDINMPQGTSVMVPASVKHYTIKGKGVCYKAGVPV